MRLPTILADYRLDNGDLPAYAWPGGYAIAYLMDDTEFLCARCVNDESNPVHSFPALADGWRVDGYVSSDWHDVGEGDWVCAHCNGVIDKGDEQWGTYAIFG